MPSLHSGWRIIGLLAAVVFLGMALRGVVRGRFDDPETGTLNRVEHPVLFWLCVAALVVMGLYLLAVAVGLPWLAGPTANAAGS
jgi:hypothetical protein